MGRRTRWAAVLVTAIAGGCGSIFENDDCTTEAVFGLAVDVVDARTDAPAGRGAVVVARDGAFADTAIRYPSPDTLVQQRTFVLAAERPGTYEVTVERAGYQPWRQAGVRVTEGGCHVRVTRITARLTPVP